MSENSKIEWCDHTFNGWIGCTKVSRESTGGGGCDRCYAEVSTPVRVLRGKGTETWGVGAPRVRTSAPSWAMPKRWNAQAGAFRAQHGRRQRVFCASLSDWLDNAVDVEWLVDLLGLIRSTPDLDWLLLSKRIGNWRGRLEAAADWIRERLTLASETVVGLLRWIERWLAGDAPANVWIGATVVNQAEADRDIPKLLQVPARVRFVSMEPLLGPVDLTRYHDWLGRSEGGMWCPDCPEHGVGIDPAEHAHCLGDVEDAAPYEGIDWVIVGGESGPGARPMHPDWARGLRDQCQAAGVPFLFKQWGEWAPPAQREDLRSLGDMMRAGKAVHIYGDGREPDGHFRKGDDHLLRVGKSAAGRLLDGRTWDQFPEARHGAA